MTGEWTLAPSRTKDSEGGNIPSPRSSLIGACESDCALAVLRSARGQRRAKRRKPTEYHAEELELLLAWRVMADVRKGESEMHEICMNRGCEKRRKSVHSLGSGSDHPRVKSVGIIT